MVPGWRIHAGHRPVDDDVSRGWEVSIREVRSRGSCCAIRSIGFGKGSGST